MKILVTGGAGFIGKHLVEELENKYGCKDIDVYDIEGAPPTFDIRSGAVNWDEDFLIAEEYDVIYHLAALRSVPDSFERPREFFDTNVYGTYRLLTQAKYKKFVNVSSSSARQGISPYGMSKFLGEAMIDKLKPSNVINVRPFNIFGERQVVDGVVVRNFCKAMANDESVYIHGDGKQSKDYTYVKDFVRQLIWFAENKDSGSYEIGYQKPVSVNTIFNYLAQFYDYDKKPIYTEPRKGDVKYSKAIHKMQIEPIGFYEGLEATAKWWKEISATSKNSSFI